MTVRYRKSPAGQNTTGETEVSLENPLPVSSSIIATRIDEASATISYIGKAPIGSLASEAVWQIFKMDTGTSPQTIITWADGDAEFNNIWDNRASLTYS